MCSKQDCFHLNFKAVIQSENIQNNSESKKIYIFRETGYRPSRYGFKFSHKFPFFSFLIFFTFLTPIFTKNSINIQLF